MSRTYRKVRGFALFCNQCNKPIYGHYKNHYEQCKCTSKRYTLPTYKRYGLKAVDGIQFYPQHKQRKYWQKYRNTKLRRKSKQILKDSTNLENETFPIPKNEVDWDVF